MTELIEKTSYEAKQTILRRLLQEFKDGKVTIEQSMKALSLWYKADIELAYKAGMLHFNALDHTLKPTNSSTLNQWNDTDFSFMEIGDYILLPSLYLQAKGFK